MPAPPAPGIASLEAIWSQEDQLVENTFHYALTGTIDVAALQQIVVAYTTWATTHSGIFHDACSLVKLDARDLSSSSGASVQVNVIPPIVGTGGPGALPNNVTFSLKRLSGLRGRANRGRIYLIGVADSHLQVGAQELTNAFAATSITAYNDLLAGMLASAGAEEVILHRALGTGTKVIEYGFADLFMDSQRRRLPGHNRHH